MAKTTTCKRCGTRVIVNNLHTCTPKTTKRCPSCECIPCECVTNTVTTPFEPVDVEEICDAFGKGFDQCIRDLPNPYKKHTKLHYAYQYGKEVGYAAAKAN